MRYAAAGIAAQPIGDPEMVLRGRKPRVESESALEMCESFLEVVLGREQEADLVLYAGGLGIERGGFLPRRQRTGCIAPGLRLGGARFHLLQGLLAAKPERHSGQEQ